MLRAGDVLDLGPLETKFYVKKTAAGTKGQSFEMEWDLGPQTGGTPIHIHPHTIETYEVLQGNLDVFINGNWRTLSTGEKVTVGQTTLCNHADFRIHRQSTGVYSVIGIKAI